MHSDVDYKELYLTMVRACEEAIRILIRAQQECEEQYLSYGDRAKAEKPVISLVSGKQ